MAIFNSIFGSLASISIGAFMACLGVSLAIGIFITFMYSRHSDSSKSFMATLALLPAVVCVVIMLVNGNIGAGVAVAGAFSLVRFRSAQGSAKEIGAIFLAMGAGLIAGMGYLLFAAIFAVIVSIAFIAFSNVNFNAGKSGLHKTLTITIPETLDYTHVFDDIFEKNTSSHELTHVKTTNMGSLFKLSYDVTLKNETNEKAMIDEIRERNGNLEISINKTQTAKAEL